MAKQFSIHGLPIVGGPDTVEDGSHFVEHFTDPLKGVTLAPGYLTVKDNEVVAYGLQPHCSLWSKEG